MSILNNSLFPLMEQALNELKERESKLQQETQKLQKQTEWVANHQLKQEKIIKLNVGGIHYCTSLSTLQSDSNSMLAAMFSGRFALEKDTNDAFFIDRNGEVFKHVLEFLRTGKICPVLSQQDLFWLREEAEFFQLPGLTDLLKEAIQQCVYLVADDKSCEDGNHYNSWVDRNLVPKILEGYQVVPLGSLKMKLATESCVPKRFLLYKY